MVERLAFRQVGYYDGHECRYQSSSYEEQRDFMGAVPSNAGQTFEEFEDGTFKDPKSSRGYIST